MKHEDLIKKLENLKTPEIELPGHKQALRMALLNSIHFKKRTMMDWARILAPATAAVLLVVLGFFNIIQPQLQIARAKEIARNDPQVQELMGGYGLDISAVRLQDGEALVLLAPQLVYAASDRSAEESVAGYVVGYVLKVDLVEKKVIGFGQIEEGRAFEGIKPEDIDFVPLEPSEEGGS